MAHTGYIYLLILVSILLSSCVSQESKTTPPEKNTIQETKKPEAEAEAVAKPTSEDIVKNKIETIRKRLALKGLIIDGDAYYREWQLTLALKKYQNFYAQNSDDDLIKKKIADTYFEMKKFESALNYYQKISSPDSESKKNINLSLWYMTDLRDPIRRNDLKKTLQELHGGSETWFYHTNSLSCIDNFHICKKDFDEYFISQEVEWKKNLNYSELIHIHEAIENYRNFQVQDIPLKNAYIIGAYFEDNMYNLAASLWEQLLEDAPWYKPVLKIVAQSYFELGDYENARSTLTKYYELDDDDAAIAYMLWIIHTKLQDFILSPSKTKKKYGLLFKIW